jgi:type IV secretory pathway VirJ component
MSFRFAAILAAVGLSAWILTLPATAADRQSAQRPALPLIEVPTTVPGGDAFVVFYSGDGGWAVSDRGFSKGLADSGVPVVGVDSLHYFLRGKTPDGAAADLARIIDHYSRLWDRPRVILSGYSFGAGAVALIAQHLPPETRRRVSLVALVGLQDPAELVLRPRSYFNIKGPGALPVGPALAAIRTAPVICIYGATDKDAACEHLPGEISRAVRVPGGHHFNGQYEAVARAIAASAGIVPIQTGLMQAGLR